MSEKLFLCAGGDADDCSDEMKAFLDCISTKKVSGDLVSRIDKEVRESRKVEEWRSGYMMWIDMQNEIKEEGRKEGRKEGALETLFGIVKDGIITASDAAKRAGMSVEDFQKKMSATT